MKVIENFKDNYQEDPIRYWEFTDFEERANDCVFFVGCHAHPEFIKQKFDVPKYYFASEEQVPVRDHWTEAYASECDMTFTICPPKFTNREKRTSSFFPFNPKYTPPDTPKIYDVIYTGLSDQPHVRPALDVIKHYNYRFTSFGSGPLITNTNVSYFEKLKLISQTKISIIHNMVYPFPQLKSRPFEAGFCKSLMLVLRDDYNIIEEWFTPDVDFVYYDTPTLKQTLDHILSNFSQYQHIIDNAFKKCNDEYTTERFIEKYIGFKS